MSEQNFDEVRSKVEAILFSFGDWVSSSDIMQTLGLDSELMISNALTELEQKYKEGFPFHVEQHTDSGKWRMALKPEFDEVVTEIISGTEIPQPVLKVLSVIAYEQPVTKTRLAEILGKSVKQEVDYLYRNKFLSYEKNGIGKYYKVTKKFYDYFKLDEDEEFRDAANKSISTYLEDPKLDDEGNVIEEPSQEVKQEE